MVSVVVIIKKKRLCENFHGSHQWVLRAERHTYPRVVCSRGCGAELDAAFFSEIPVRVEVDTFPDHFDVYAVPDPSRIRRNGGE